MGHKGPLPAFLTEIKGKLQDAMADLYVLERQLSGEAGWLLWILPTRRLPGLVTW